MCAYPKKIFRPVTQNTLIFLFGLSEFYMGLDLRKPNFGGLWTTQAQTSLRICIVWSAPLLFTF